MGEMYAPSPRQATYLPYLLECVYQTHGAILELGAGTNSTPLLNALGRYMNRPITTVEEDADWLRLFEGFPWEGHQLYNELPDHLWSYPWSVVLVDCGKDSRGPAIERLENVKHMVIHDTEEDYPGVKDAIMKKTGVQVVTYNTTTPWTTVVTKAS